MTFALPTFNGFVEATPEPLSTFVEPPMVASGEQQRFQRAGSKMALNVKLPPMEWDEARFWVAALMRSEREKVRYEWPQVGFTPDNIGVTVVGAGGATALASVIPVAGLAPGAGIAAGRWFNHVKGDVRRLYSCVQDGGTPIIIAPLARAPFVAGEALDFVTPVIEGWVEGDRRAWTENAAHHYGLEFRIVEAK